MFQLGKKKEKKVVCNPLINTETVFSSKLIYAINFYSIPLGMKKDLQKKFFSFVNFPLNTTTISQREMWNLPKYGGIICII